MKLLLSVVICTHNPRTEYLLKVLNALSCQTLSYDLWELLLIDNASNRKLAEEVDLTWHPNAYHIREERLGLTPARLRGIKESNTEVLIFVDDDNVLDRTYLKTALGISKKYPFIGAWGGQIFGEYEVSPPDWAKPYLCYLAIREFEQVQWSNLIYLLETTPSGAGMCIRKQVGDKYHSLTQSSIERINLDRVGQGLTSAGDSDLAFTACDIGLGMGLFPDLKLTHLIPKERLEKEYFLRLLEGIAYSHTALKIIRNRSLEIDSLKISTKLKNFVRERKLSKIDRQFAQAQRKGVTLAINALRSLGES